MKKNPNCTPAFPKPAFPLPPLPLLLLLPLLLFQSCHNQPKSMTGDDLRHQALTLSKNLLILDTHIDWPEHQLRHPADIGKLTPERDFDFVRAREGGLDAVCSVVYPSYKMDVEEGREAVSKTIDIINNYLQTYPGVVAPARTPAEMRENFERGLISLPLCLENGAPIGDDLDYLRWLKEQGIMYITLVHNRCNQFGDGALDKDRAWNGLSPLGRELVAEMNRLGIIVDISHATDSTAFDILACSQAPVVATHSACRAFNPGFERNIPDTLIRAVAATGGVVQIAFLSDFLQADCLPGWEHILEWADSTGIEYDSDEAWPYIREYGKTHPLWSDYTKVVDHIEHVIAVAGIDHVGIGSDFDGMGPAQPKGLPDVSAYPVLIEELLKRGYSEEEIGKIMSGNFLRVWEEVIAVGDSLREKAVSKLHKSAVDSQHSTVNYPRTIGSVFRIFA